MNTSQAKITWITNILKPGTTSADGLSQAPQKERRHQRSESTSSTLKVIQRDPTQVLIMVEAGESSAVKVVKHFKGQKRSHAPVVAGILLGLTFVVILGLISGHVA